VSVGTLNARGKTRPTWWAVDQDAVLGLLVLAGEEQREFHRVAHGGLGLVHSNEVLPVRVLGRHQVFAHQRRPSRLPLVAHLFNDGRGSGRLGRRGREGRGDWDAHHHLGLLGGGFGAFFKGGEFGLTTWPQNKPSRNDAHKDRNRANKFVRGNSRPHFAREEAAEHTTDTALYRRFAEQNPKFYLFCRSKNYTWADTSLSFSHPTKPKNRTRFERRSTCFVTLCWFCRLANGKSKRENHKKHPKDLNLPPASLLRKFAADPVVDLVMNQAFRRGAQQDCFTHTLQSQ
jgi:hypothetical protein